MSSPRWERLKEILDAALDLAAGGERDAFLAEASAGDPALQDEVLRMLGEYALLGDFLERPAARLTFAPGQLVVGRFQVVQLLGSGGMGEVYEAKDLHLEGATVALKTIRADVALPRADQRFTREVLLARSISHPNVCPIYDVFSDDGGPRKIRFLTMKRLRGQSLRERLRSGPVEPGNAHALLRQIALGLAAAHASGVVHGDLKPANIMLVESGAEFSAVITDFGLARSLVAGDAETRESTIGMGTPEYMAPEQLRGAKASVATDIYSFGVLSHEMLTGRRPAACVDEAVPAPWKALLAACMDPVPKRRPASAAALLPRMESAAGPPRKHRSRFALATLALCALAAAVFARETLLSWWRPLPAQLHVAVLPFDYGGHTTLQPLAEGVAETASALLARYEPYQKDFWIVPAADVRTQNLKNAADVSRLFGANLIVTGKLLRDTRTATLSLALLDPATGGVLSTRNIVCPTDAVSRLPQYAEENIAGMLRLHEMPVLLRGRLGATQIAEAYRLYEAGRALMRSKKADDINVAIALLQQAVDYDPGYAGAYAKLAEAYSGRYYYFRDPETIELAARNSKRALEIDPNLPDSHIGAALVHTATGRDEAARSELTRALELDPANSEAYMILARTYTRLGLLREAEQTYRKMIDLRPNYWQGYNLFGAYYWTRGNYTEAEKMFRVAVAASPITVTAQNNLGGVLAASGRCADAVPIFQKSISLAPSAGAYTNLGNCYFDLRQYDEATRAMTEATRLNPREHIVWRNLGDVYRYGSGDRGRARECYAQAAEAALAAYRVNPKDAQTLSSLALYQAKLGRAGETRAYLDELSRLPGRDLNVLFRRAIALEIVGDRAAALRVIRQALDGGYSRKQVDAAPELAQLRADPRFAATLTP